MRIVLIVAIGIGAAFPAAVMADDGSNFKNPVVRPDLYDGTGDVGVPRRVEQHTRFVPCIGQGYISYAYPAFDSCPCGAKCCYHPGRYYYGGKPYKRQWFKTWLRAHLGKGSMLDPYPCDCRFPIAGRIYISKIPVPKKSKEISPMEPDSK